MEEKTIMNNEMKKTTHEGTSPVAIIFLALGLFLAAYASFLSCGLFETDDGEREKTQLKQRCTKDVDVAMDAYDAKVRAIIDEHDRFLQREAKGDFDRVRQGIPAIAKGFCTFGHVKDVVVNLALDKIKKTDRSGEQLRKQLGPTFIAPCQAASAKVVARHERMLAELEEAREEAGRELQVSLATLDQSAGIAMPLQTYQNDIFRIEHDIGRLESAKFWTTVSAGMELAFIRSTLKAISRLAAKAVAKATATAALPALDGPFPFGDILAVCGVALTGYDIHVLCKKLPRELKKTMGTTVDNLEHETITRSHNAMVDAEKAYLDAGGKMRQAAIRATR